MMSIPPKFDPYDSTITLFIYPSGLQLSISQFTMPYLQKFLAGLMLFSPAIYAIATPDQAELGKVKGFTGPAHVNPKYVPFILLRLD